MKSLNSSIYVSFVLAASILSGQQPPAQSQTPVSPIKAPSLRPATPAPDKPASPPVIVAPDTVILSVGTEKMTRAQFEDVPNALAENGRPAATPAAKRQVAEQLGELMTLAQEARKRKLDQAAPVKQMMVIQSDQVLAGALVRQVTAEVTPDEAALRAYYDQNKSKYEQTKASHILIRYKGSRVPLKPGGKDLTEDEALAKAQDIRKKLLAGGDFAAIAKAESDDAGTGANGGSLGAFGRGQMVPEFEKAAFSLPLGEISEPVKSPFGYHIIKVEERTSKTFEEARADVEKQLKPKLTQEAMDRIKKQLPVTLDDSYFGK